MFDRFDFSRGYSPSFAVPEWFRRRPAPTQEEETHWLGQYRLAMEGKPHQVPDWAMRHPANAVHQLLAKDFWAQVPKDFGSILDVGCSDGYMVNIFSQTGKKAVGINDVQLPVDKAYAHLNDLDIRVGDMHCMEIADQTFDAVWCRHTLEHSFAPVQVLAEIHRVLKPGGYLFAVLPPPPGTPEPYPDHWHQIPEYQFRYLLEACNFNVLMLQTSYFSHLHKNDNLEIRAVCRKL
jgi:SAM-dependent methyltransferase